ncbi:hypothetical protein [Glutamicibacter sp. V16R2B1]|uniref:hypothetical protein n=1 Tax=Glutamicibacter sp. V16R2B1 TaxID=2036207 RepID=UPI0010FDF4F9|nr:hypothetical protein [Glutamicibacter sp. V16R2B1]TLK49773.1 hypothetical protein FDN03_13245 [Glutamicibacter sp. V16R2B1]
MDRAALSPTDRDPQDQGPDEPLGGETHQHQQPPEREPAQPKGSGLQMLHLEPVHLLLCIVEIVEADPRQAVHEPGRGEFGQPRGHLFPGGGVLQQTLLNHHGLHCFTSPGAQASGETQATEHSEPTQQAVISGAQRKDPLFQRRPWHPGHDGQAGGRGNPGRLASAGHHHRHRTDGGSERTPPALRQPGKVMPPAADEPDEQPQYRQPGAKAQDPVGDAARNIAPFLLAQAPERDADLLGARQDTCHLGFLSHRPLCLSFMIPA